MPEKSSADMGWCEEQGPHEDVDCIVPTWLASRGLCFRTPLRGERWLKRPRRLLFSYKQPGGVTVGYLVNRL